MVLKMTMFQPCKRRVDGKPASYLLLAVILPCDNDEHCSRS